MAASLSDNPGVIAQKIAEADNAEEKEVRQNFDNLPLDLQKADRWVVWKSELTKDGKPTKVPYVAKIDAHGKRASTTDPATWSTFKEARDTFFCGGYDGIGFVLGWDIDAQFNYCGIDIDHLETEEDWERARDIANWFDSYCDISPSGKGIHIYVNAYKGSERNRCKHTKKHIEIYDHGRFFTVTGERFGSCPNDVNIRSEVLEAFYDETFNDEARLKDIDEDSRSKSFEDRAQELEADQKKTWSESATSKKTRAKSTSRVKVTKEKVVAESTATPKSITDQSRPASVLSDDQVIQKASDAANGVKFKGLYFEGDTSAYNDDDSSADAALMAMLVFYTRDPGQLERLFSTSALGQREKWIKRKDYRDRTIKSSLEFVKETYNPSCSSGHGGGQGGDSTDKPAIRMVTLDSAIGLIGMCSDFGTIVKVIEVGTKNDKEKYLLWISDCAVHIDTETRAKNEAELVFRGIGAVDKRDVKFTLRAGDLAEPRKFKAALLNAFGAKNQVGRLNFETVQKMSLNPQLVQRVEAPTWDEKGGPLMPGMDLVKNVEYRLSSMIPARVYDGDLSQAKESLRKLLRVHKCAPLLVAVVLGAPAIARWRKNDRFGLGLWGLTGTLKTTTALTAMGIYGLGYLDGPKLKAGKAGSTAIGAMELFAAAGFLPQIYDDMKTVDTRDAQNYVAVLHSVLEGQEKARGKKDGGLRESREFTCTPIITGEIRPQEASTSARVLNLNWTSADGKLLTEVQANAALLPVIGYHWLRFLAGTDHAFGENFEARRSAMVEKFSGLHFVNSGRLATIYILMKSVWDLLEKSPLGDVFTESREMFETALDAAIEVQGRAVSEETEVARFLSALEELLASNPGIVQSLDGTKTIMGNVIGCWMPEGLFLLPTETLNELVKIKTFSQAPSIDSLTQGLNDLGLLILGDDRRLKYRMRFNGARPWGWYIKYNVVSHNPVLSPLAPLSEATKNDNIEATGPVSPLSPQKKGENISETNLKPIEPLKNTKKGK